MKHVQTYELFRAKHSSSALSCGLDRVRITDAIKRNVRHAKDLLTIPSEIKVDKHVFDEKELAKNINSIIKIFSKLHSFFGAYRYAKVNGSFSGFLYAYDDLVREYGFYPTNITRELVNSVLRTNGELADCYGGWISEDKKAKKLYDDAEELANKIHKGYYEFEEEVSKYNL